MVSDHSITFTESIPYTIISTQTTSFYTTQTIYQYITETLVYTTSLPGETDTQIITQPAQTVTLPGTTSEEIVTLTLPPVTSTVVGPGTTEITTLPGSSYTVTRTVGQMPQTGFLALPAARPCMKYWPIVLTLRP